MPSTRQANTTANENTSDNVAKIEINAPVKKNDGFVSHYSCEKGISIDWHKRIEQ